MSKIILPELEIKVSLKNKSYTKFKISGSKDVFEFAKQIFNADTILWQEEFILVCLNRANFITAVHRVSSGGVSGVIVDPKVIFSIALQSCASHIIVLHNHPSGNMQPSTEDEKVTAKLKHGGELLEIKLLDHIIMSGEMDTYYSFADQGNVI